MADKVRSYFSYAKIPTGDTSLLEEAKRLFAHLSSQLSRESPKYLFGDKPCKVSYSISLQILDFNLNDFSWMRWPSACWPKFCTCHSDYPWKSCCLSTKVLWSFASEFGSLSGSTGRKLCNREQSDVALLLSNSYYLLNTPFYVQQFVFSDTNKY